MSNNANEFAFPVSTIDGFTQHGMMLRDYFAGQALAGMSSIALEDGDMLLGWADMAKASYKAADAMLAAREAKP